MNSSAPAAGVEFDGRLIIHIGMHKTGTTSIQHALDANYASLRSRRILYPKAGRVRNGEIMSRHHPLAWSLMGETDQPLSVHIEPLRQEVKDAAPSVVILSSEHLCGANLPPNVLQDIKQIFPSADRTWIIYLRRQDRLAMSRYAENIKTGKVAWPSGIRSRISVPSLDFKMVIQRLQHTVGDDKLVPVSFDASKAKLIQSFCETAGIAAPDGRLADIRENTGLPWGTLQALRLANAIPGLAGRFSRRKIFSLYRRIAATSFSWMLDWPAPLSPAKQAEVLKTFEDSNRWVETTFWNDERFLTGRSGK